MFTKSTMCAWVAGLVVVAAATPAAAQESEGDSGIADSEAGAERGTADTGVAEAAAPDCRRLDPATQGIVNGDRIYPFKPRNSLFINWRLKKANPACWPAYTINTQDEFGATAINPAFWQKGYPVIDAIVIHETTQDRGLTRADTGVHFLVERDGTIIQLADLNTRYNHASNSVVNNRAIGIEISNEPFPDFSSKAVRHDDGKVVKVSWALGGSIAISPAEQLEAVSELVKALLALRESTPAARPLPRSGIAIPATWHNFAINNEFLFSMNGYRIFNASIDPHIWASRRLIVEQPGISSHSIIYDHGDGGAPLLYAWLDWRGRGSPAADLIRILTTCSLHRLTARDPLVKIDPPIFGKDYEVTWVGGKRVVTTKEIETYPMARLLTFASNCTDIDLSPPAGDLEEIGAAPAPAPEPPAPAPEPPAPEVGGTVSEPGDTANGSVSDTAEPPAQGDVGEGPSNPPGADIE